jgi:hypothetical protein
MPSCDGKTQGKRSLNDVLQNWGLIKGDCFTPQNGTRNDNLQVNGLAKFAGLVGSEKTALARREMPKF